MKKAFICFGLLLPVLFPRLLAQNQPDSVAITHLIEKAVLTGPKDSSAAEKMFHQAVDAATHINSPYLAGKAYYELAQMFYAYKVHNRSFGALFNARPFFTQAGARKELAYTLFGMGREQYYRGNYKVAAEHLNFAIREAETLKLPLLESDALEYLGILYHIMPGTRLESIPQLQKALGIKEKLNDRKGRLRMLEKLAEVYYEQADFDSALDCLDKSIALAASMKLFHDADISRLDRAGALSHLHKLEEAQMQIAYIKEHGDTADLNIGIRYFTQLGNLMVMRSRFTEARENYNAALQVANRIGVPDMYGMVYKNMAGFYSAMGMYKEAYEFSRQYNEQLKGYYSENTSSIKDLEYIFNNSLTRDQVTLLSNENKLKEITLQHERQLRPLILSGATAFLLLAVLIYYLYRAQKAKNRLIKRQTDELKTLMREIHHRVKNNLQIISSLLDLQSMTVRDGQASQAIKEGRNRVQSMALIHQNLYGDTDLIAIAVDEYIDSLAQNLFSSYNIQQGQIELKTHIEKMKLDVDTVIPIGLMLNELISNSLKHAFEKGRPGLIELTLKKEKDALLMEVKDNGKGFPKPIDPPRPETFGMRMIRIFAQKLKADLNIYNDQGACVVMRMRKYRLFET
jgi:two-component sensor histidine kinase